MNQILEYAKNEFPIDHQPEALGGWFGEVSLRAGNNADGGIDLDVLESLKSLQQPDEPDFVTELIDLFLSDTASHLSALRAALADCDFTEVGRIAHLMKGSSGNIGAVRLAEIFRLLEAKDLATRDSGNDGNALLLKLEAEFELVSEAFRSHRQND
jgi:HPt (histidine-containing phosphotransfer) domain-containing protein